MSRKNRRERTTDNQPEPGGSTDKIKVSSIGGNTKIKNVDIALGLPANKAEISKEDGGTRRRSRRRKRRRTTVYKHYDQARHAEHPHYNDNQNQAVDGDRHQHKTPTRHQTVNTQANISTSPRRRFKYLGLGLLGLALLWIPALLFIWLSEPDYQSSWTIVIPGTTTGSSINLDSLGEANTSVDSQYRGHAIDPKVNYKAIILSSTVLRNAAQLTNMTFQEFGKPKIKLVDQTAMVTVSTKANSAELAQEKADNLYIAFAEELESLRSSERIIKQVDSLQQLDEYQAAVEETQLALQTFRENAEIISVGQYTALLERIGKLTESKADTETRLAAMTARFSALEASIGMDPGTAASIIKLRQDLMVQSQLRAYSDAHSAMVKEEAVLGSKHPKVVHARSRTQLAYSALTTRADEVLGTSSKALLDHFMPTESSTDSALYAHLVELHAEKLAMESEVDSIEQKIQEMKARVLIYTEEVSRLKELERDNEIASTILVSATARLDLGKSDIYASYPMTQLLAPAELPESPGRLKILFALLGAIMGSLFVIAAIILLWNRKLWLQLILKSV